MRKVEIKVAIPCSEKWESFEKRGLNGFCSSCEKEVIDFTKMSDFEIKNYFKKSTGDVCGRMYSKQQKVYEGTSKIKLKPFASALMTGAALLFTGTSTLAQSKDRIEQTDRVNSDEKNTSKTNNETRTISGTVTDESGETLPGVNVVIKGTKIGTSTDLDGNYNLNVNINDILIFSFVGFVSHEVAIGERSDLDISMTGFALLGEVITGGIHSRWYSPRSLWWRIKNLFRKNY